MYYGYRQRIRQRIEAGELTGAYETDGYPRIGTALVLVFRTTPFLRPIRPHRWAEYRALLDSMGIPIERIGGNVMSEQEKKILENIKTAMKTMPPEKLAYLLAYSEGMAAAAAGRPA